MLDGLFFLLTIITGGVAPFFYKSEQYVLCVLTAVLGLGFFVALFNTNKIVKPRVTTETVTTDKVKNISFSRPVSVTITKTIYPWRLQEPDIAYRVNLEEVKSQGKVL